MNRRIEVDFHGWDDYVTAVIFWEGERERSLLKEIGEKAAGALIDEALASGTWLLDWWDGDGSTAFLVGPGTQGAWVTWAFLESMARPFLLISSHAMLTVAERPGSAALSRNDLALATGGAA